MDKTQIFFSLADKIEKQEFDDEYLLLLIEFWQDEENKVDVSAIIDECQEEVSSIQEEMESLCTNFLISASDNDLDMLSFGRMKSNFTMAYSDLEKKANDAFDRCIKELNRVGDTSSANQMKEEKQEFNSASLKQRYETQASAEMVD